MADNSILTPGYQDVVENTVTIPESTPYLEIDNFLSEYDTDDKKFRVRENLEVSSKKKVDELESELASAMEGIRGEILLHLESDDPHGTLADAESLMEDMVKTDGSTPFKSPQEGLDPKSDMHLTTKRYVDTKIKNHELKEDPHKILPEVETLLERYAKTTDIYDRSLLYTKQDVDRQASDYIRKDGTTPFTKALVGADPQIDGHLTTKRYVDKVMYNHKVEIDPHGFMQILNLRLAAYAKKRDFLDKTLTYSRTLIDSIINNIVNSEIDGAISDYMESVNDKFEYIRLLKYIKQDGTIPFRAPQSGVDAVDESDLTTLRQLNQIIKSVKDNLSELILSKECVWKTSGPVEATVGHVENNTVVPETMTLQEVCDAIFYGKGISLEVPEYVTIAEPCEVTMCIHGSTGLIQYAELYLNGQLIETIQKEEFENGCVTVSSLPLYEDSEFTFKVYYTNGSVHEETKVVKCCMPVFVGLLPKWKFANTITMDYLIELCKEDVDGTLNRFLDYGEDLKSITFKYNFTDSKLRHPFVVLPANYPDLDSMVTKSQSFEVDAFDVINMIPLQVPGIENDVIYKIYVYRLALSSLNLEVTFNFKSRQE